MSVPFKVLKFPCSDGNQVLVQATSKGNHPLDLKLVGTEGSAAYRVTCKLSSTVMRGIGRMTKIGVSGISEAGSYRSIEGQELSGNRVRMGGDTTSIVPASSTPRYPSNCRRRARHIDRSHSP